MAAQSALPNGREHDPLRPLTGVRILDLTNTWAAPRGATMLGDLGADVIKVEGIEWMDMLRGFTSPPNPHPWYPRSDPREDPWNRYLMWLGISRNKRNASIEFTTPAGREILRELIAACDVVLTNMSIETREKYDLVYDRLTQINPTVIFASLSAYGPAGPRSSWRLFGDGQAAMAGMFSGTGYPGEESLTFGAYGDPVNGVALAFHVVQALRLRRQTGRGTWVDVSSVGTCLSYSVRSLIETQVGEDGAANVGVDAGERWPHGVFRCAGEDRWVAISCGSDTERAALADGLRALGLAPPDSEDRDSWNSCLAAASQNRDPATIERAFRDRGVPCQAVMRGRDVDGALTLTSRQFIRWLWRDDIGAFPVYSPFWMINGERPPVALPPALYGQHTEEILRTVLGKTDAEIAQLRADAVTADRPLKGAELGVRPG